MCSPVRIWRIFNTPCAQMAAWSSRVVDDQRLSGWERAAWRLHLLYCRACRRYVRQIRALRTSLQSAALVAVDNGAVLSVEARARLLRRLRKSSR